MENPDNKEVVYLLQTQIESLDQLAVMTGNEWRNKYYPKAVVTNGVELSESTNRFQVWNQIQRQLLQGQ